MGVFRHHLGQPVGEGSGNRTGKRHQLRGLVAGAAEHHALVSRAAHLVIGSQSNVRGLGVNPALDLHRIGAEAILRPGVADVPDHLTGNGFIVHRRTGGNLAGNATKVRGHQGFTSYPGIGVLGQAGVQNAVRNPVGHLVRVAGCHTF